MQYFYSFFSDAPDINELSSGKEVPWLYRLLLMAVFAFKVILCLIGLFHIYIG